MAQTAHGTDWAGCSMPSSFPSDADSIPFEPPQYPDIILPRTTQLIRISKNQKRMRMRQLPRTTQLIRISKNQPNEMNEFVRYRQWQHAAARKGERCSRFSFLGRCAIAAAKQGSFMALCRDSDDGQTFSS